MKKWKILSSKIVFDQPWCKIRVDAVKIPSGKTIKDYYLSVRDDYVIIFPTTPKGKVVLVKQYRHGVGQILWELPGGIVASHESPEETARRELLEETGYCAEKIHLLGVFYDNPTKNTNKMYAYRARNVTKKGHPALEETEQIQVQEVPVRKIKDFITQKRFNSLSSVLCALLALSKLEGEL